MFALEMNEKNQLYINGFLVVDFHKPFHRLVGHASGIDRIMRTPSESLSRQKKPLTYYVKMTSTRAGALFNSDVRGLQCHWVYNTNTGISPLFRDKTLLTLLNNLDTSLDTYEKIRGDLKSIVWFLWKSFPFDLIMTSLRHLPELLPKVPIEVMPLMLTSLPRQIAVPSVRYGTLQALLKGHPGGVPLSLLTGESFRFLSLRHTNFQKEKIRGCKNVLIIEGTNTYYSGFLARELSFLGVRNVLPTTLFHIGN